MHDYTQTCMIMCKRGVCLGPSRWHRRPARP